MGEGSSQRVGVGIDIGGTKISLGLVTEQGAILACETFPTESRLGVPHACLRIEQAITKLAHENDREVASLAGIGIGCPGPMDRLSGHIHNPHTLPGWEEGSLTQELHNRLGLRAALENDADGALLGEAFIGAGAGSPHVAMLTFGTGVGGAALCGGRIHRGLEDEHPEFGLMPILPDEATDYSGVPGSLESLASGMGIAQAGESLGFASTKAVFAADSAGDPKAKRVIDRAARAISLACLNLAHLFCPERIVLGGGLMDHHYARLTRGVAPAMSQATLLPPNRIQVLKAKLGNLAGLVGAASLVLHEAVSSDPTSQL